MKNKGFTLVELLAVIVILGILISFSTIAVSSIITNSRKDTFIESAQNYIEACKTLAANAPGRYYPQEEGKNNSTVVYIKDLPITEKETDAFNSKLVDNKSFIRIEGTRYGYEFYITLVDEAGHSIVDIKESDLNKNLIDTQELNFEPTIYHVVDKDITVGDSKKCVILGDVNGDKLVNDKDAGLCDSIANGNYQLTEAEYDVLTNNGIRTETYRQICNFIRNHSNGYGSTKVTIYKTIDGFNKYYNYSEGDC